MMHTEWTWADAFAALDDFELIAFGRDHADMDEETTMAWLAEMRRRGLR